MDNEDFEVLYAGCRNAVERFVFYKMPTKHDGEDCLQEALLLAFLKFDQLKDRVKFKPWLLSIAANVCNAHYRQGQKVVEIELKDDYSYKHVFNKTCVTTQEIVIETLEAMKSADKQMLHLYYIRNLRQKDISQKLRIPVGTVKSRLSTAKRNFKERYPYPPDMRGENVMKKFPEIMPEVKITKSDKPPFEVKCKELPNWFIIPELGEKISWASYNYPGKKLDDVCRMTVVGKIMVHGIEGVEIQCVDEKTNIRRELAAQLTDTRIRYLSETHYDGDMKHVTTFLDEEFLKNWGYGEDNFGREIMLNSRGDSKTPPRVNMINMTGRYEVVIAGKAYDTILMVEYTDFGVFVESYIDANGRTVLWRRYNKDDMLFEKYESLWSERLPENEKIKINKDIFVHWYDCISDYIL